MRYDVDLTRTALAMLDEIQDRRVRGKLLERIDRLSEDPERQGKALMDDLAGFRAVRAVGQRYRIIFQVQARTVQVIVVGLGLRRQGSRADIYRTVSRLLRDR